MRRFYRRGPGLGGPRHARQLEQPAEIALGIVEAVQMVHPEAGEAALAQEPADQPVGLLEHHRVLDPDGGELVLVEEPPVVDLLGGDPPVRQPVRLPLEEPVQAVEAARVPGLPVDGADAVVDDGVHPGKDAGPTPVVRRKAI